jgi:hypothetical protein
VEKEEGSKNTECRMTKINETKHKWLALNKYRIPVRKYGRMMMRKLRRAHDRQKNEHKPGAALPSSLAIMRPESVSGHIGYFA